MIPPKNIDEQSALKRRFLPTSADQWVSFLDVIWSNQTRTTLTNDPRWIEWNSEGLKAFPTSSHATPVNLRYEGTAQTIKMFPGQLDVSVSCSLVDTFKDTVGDGFCSFGLKHLRTEA